MKQKNSRAAANDKKVLTGSNLLMAFIGFLFIFSCSTVLVLNIRQIYYCDIGAQHLPEEVSMTEAQIRANYDVLIDYNLLWKNKDTLEFPDFPMSEHGRIHFEEVKRIFAVIQYLAVGSFVLLFAGLWGKIRGRDYGCLKLTAVLTVGLPVILGTLVSLNWEWFFISFHRLVFSNDYWLFDPDTDPVIWILPDAFFLHCAAAILIFMVIGSAVMWGAYLALERRRQQKRMKH